MRTKIKLPLPFISQQVNLKISKLNELEPLDFYILLIPYLVIKKQIKKDELLIDVLKEKFNLNDSWFALVLKRINKLVELNMLSNVKKTKLNKGSYVGNIEINDNLAAMFDKDKFFSFDKDKRNEICFYYQNLFKLNDEGFSFVQKNNSKYQNSKNNVELDSYESAIDKETAINVIKQSRIINDNYEVISDYYFANDNKLIFIDTDFEFDINTEELTLNIPKPNDLKTLEDIKEKDKKFLKEILNVISRKLSTDEIKNKVTGYKLYKSFFKDENELNSILKAFHEQVELFHNTQLNSVFYIDKLLILGKEHKEISIPLLENEKLKISIINAYTFPNKESEIKFLQDHFNFEEFSTDLVNKYFSKDYIEILIELSMKQINELRNKKNVLEFYNDNLKLFKQQIQNFKLDLEQSFFDSNLQDSLIELFTYDAQHKRQYVKQFKEFNIDKNTEKKLNNIYKLDYSNGESYFKNSIDEIKLKNIFSSLKRAETIMKSATDNNMLEIEDIKDSIINDMKNITCFEPNFIFENQSFKNMNDFMYSNKNKLIDNIKKQANNNRVEIEKFAKKELNIKDTETKNVMDYINKAKLEEIKFSNKADGKKIIEIYNNQNPYNHHFGPESISLTKLKEILKKLDNDYVELQKIIKRKD